MPIQLGFFVLQMTDFPTTHTFEASISACTSTCARTSAGRHRMADACRTHRWIRCIARRSPRGVRAHLIDIEARAVEAEPR